MGNSEKQHWCFHMELSDRRHQELLSEGRNSLKNIQHILCAIGDVKEKPQAKEQRTPWPV